MPPALTAKKKMLKSASVSGDGAKKAQGYPRVRVKEIAGSIQYGHTASAVDRISGPRFLRITDIQNGRVDWSAVPSCDIPVSDIPKYRLSHGDIVFARTGATTGKSFLIDDCPEAVFASYLIRIRVSADVDPRFLAAFFQSPDYWQQIERGKRGIGQPNVNGKTLGEVQVPLPGLDQQRQIVEEIEKQFTRLDVGVAALRRAQANLKRYRTAVLKAACEGRLVPTEAELARHQGRTYEPACELLARIFTERRKNRQGRGKYKEPAVPETAHLSQLPEGWAWTTLDQVNQEGRPIIYGIIKPGPHIPTGVPYVRVTEMKDGQIDVSSLRKASFERAAKFARATLAAGDVLISKDGTIGRVAVVPPELAGGNITQHVMRAPIHKMMCLDYVVWAIRSDWCQHWLTGETRGVALRGVNVEDFRRLPIPIPPVAEQERIVAEVERRLSVIEGLESIVTANLQRASRLRQSILQKAFTKTCP